MAPAAIGDETKVQRFFTDFHVISLSEIMTRRCGRTEALDYLATGFCLVALMLIPVCSQISGTTRTEIQLGGLFSPDRFDATGYTAFRLAIDYVNSRIDILPNITLSYVRSSYFVSGTFEMIKAACSLVQEGPVAVIGPATTADVKAVSPIFAGLHIPHVSPSATDPTLSEYDEQYPYLFKMGAPDYYQSLALLSIIKRFGWTRLAIIASATDYGRNGMTVLQSEALKRDLVISDVVFFPSSCNATNETIKPMLNQIKNKGTRIIVLNCLAHDARIVLDEAFSLGMLNSGWAWITTDGVTAMEELYNSCVDVPLHLQGLLGTRPLSSAGTLYNDFVRAWNSTETTSEEQYASAVFDAVLATAYGIHELLSKGNVLVPPVFSQNACTSETVSPWQQGKLLAEFIANSSGEGVAHFLNFTELHYPGVRNYDIVNLRRKGWEEVGTWMSDDDEGHLDMKQPVYFPGLTGRVPDDKKVDLTDVKLRVVTIIEEPFTMEEAKSDFGSDSAYKGYCIDLLNKLQEELGFQYDIYLVPDGNYGGKDRETGHWDGMVAELIEDKADLVVAPLTINYEREQVVDFTNSYQDLGDIIIMAKESPHPSIFAFLDPFSANVWIVLSCAFVFFGLATTAVSWLSPFGKRGAFSSGLEPGRQKYKDDRNAFNLWNSLWHIFSMWMMQGSEGAPSCLSGRLVYGAWFFIAMVISATYTANLAAFLTVQRLDSGVSSLWELANQNEIAYGTVRGAATSEFFRIQVTEPYKTMHAFMETRSTYVPNSTAGLRLVRESYGKPPSERYAFIFDSIPLEYAANQPPCHMETIGRLFNQFGYGLALQKNSPYLELFSLEVLKLRQSGFLNTLYAKWVISGTCQVELEASRNGDAQQATLMQMMGVFLLMGGIVILAFFVILFEYCAAARNDKQKDTSLSFGGAFLRRCKSVSSDVRRNIGTCLCCRREADVRAAYNEAALPRDAVATVASCDSSHVVGVNSYANDISAEECDKYVNGCSTSKM